MSSQSINYIKWSDIDLGPFLKPCSEKRRESIKQRKNQLSREKKLEGHISHHRSMKFQSLELPMMSSSGAFYFAKMKIGFVMSLNI